MGLKTNQISARLGQKTYDEVIHRDNLVITGDQRALKAIGEPASALE
jgi:hypothetical protein